MRPIPAPEPRDSSPPLTVQGVARRRRARLEQTWTPAPGERARIFYELRQGARRPATLERLALIYRMQGLFLEFSRDDPMAVVSVYLDRAAEAEAHGQYEQERVALREALELTRDSAVVAYAMVRYAAWLWRQGDVGEARGRLLGREDAEARDLLALIEDREPEREALREAERLLGAISSPPVRSPWPTCGTAIPPGASSLHASCAGGTRTSRWLGTFWRGCSGWTDGLWSASPCVRGWRSD